MTNETSTNQSEGTPLGEYFKQKHRSDACAANVDERLPWPVVYKITTEMVFGGAASRLGMYPQGNEGIALATLMERAREEQKRAPFNNPLTVIVRDVLAQYIDGSFTYGDDGSGNPITLEAPSTLEDLLPVAASIDSARLQMTGLDNRVKKMITSVVLPQLPPTPVVLAGMNEEQRKKANDQLAAADKFIVMVDDLRGDFSLGVCSVPYPDGSKVTLNSRRIEGQPDPSARAGRWSLTLRHWPSDELESVKEITYQSTSDELRVVRQYESSEQFVSTAEIEDLKRLISEEGVEAEDLERIVARMRAIEPSS
ncbi:hypothetical protein FWG95_01830 [Candidatus Saccharibacteria bacterium]|nr:hypothetical protein [Candidatus Saccharibacteria bacterium]